MVINNPQIILRLAKVYNSKKKEMTRPEFCEILGLENTNHSTTSRVISVLVDYEIAQVSRGVYTKVIYLDRKRLEKFIRNSQPFLELENFIHNSLLGAIT